MIRTSFNQGWSVRPKTSPFAAVGPGAPDWQPVTLPHDALIGLSRDAGSPQGVNGAFFPGGAFEYEKSFEVPDEWRSKRVTLGFDGVYRDAMVFVNGDYAGQRPNGYAPFTVGLDPYLKYGDSNTIRVEARAHQDSRWYSGAGIYRDVHLHVGELVHVVPGGVQVMTPEIQPDHAVVSVATTVRNASTGTVTARVRSVIRLGEVIVGSDEVPVTLLSSHTAVTRQRLRVESPALWSVFDPTLHVVETTLLLAGTELEVQHTSFGIRSLLLDAAAGLRINGESVKLRGACIHHDNGVLGAATFPRAEERRVELLKAAGFNAIRSSHNPLSPAMLDACDRLGMLVMDETFDVWTESKSDYDYSLDFPEWWRRDLAAMVEKDINHPCVVLYSIGNEIFETGTPMGAVWSRRLAEEIRALDPTRFVTNGINAAIAVLQHTQQVMAELREGPGEQDFNTMLGSAEDAFNVISASDVVTQRLEESFSVLDVVGLNYGDSRYDLDRTLHPHRVLVGSETFSTRIASNWPRIEELSHVIGDFTWTGWDYLGESGIGRPHYADTTTGVQGPFPWLTAWCGDIDITGQRRPASYLREIAFGLRAEPYLAVRRPERYGEATGPNAWGWSDSLATWTWNAAVGSPIQVEIYSGAGEVELLLNGRSIGRQGAGRVNGFTAVFECRYEPGTLEAVAFADGTETARTSLVTAGTDTVLRARVDRVGLCGDADLAFVDITFEDADGVMHTTADQRIEVSLDGPGVLQGLGSADPTTLESFTANSCRTYLGRALAVIRPTGTGAITVTVSTDASAPAVLELTAEPGAAS